MAPIAKVGGLADVSSSLPKALLSLGYDIRVILPYYQLLRKSDLSPDEVCEFSDFADRQVVILTKEIEGIPVYFVDHEVFNFPEIYEGDNLSDRFSTFSWITAKIADHLDWEPDIYHAHDWATGPVMSFLKHLKPDKSSIFTIHNLAYQGSMRIEPLQAAGLPLSLMENLIDPGEVDTIRFLRLGIRDCKLVTTVSQTYAREILTPDYGYGLEIDLQKHPRQVEGIVHGIDTEIWNPNTDQLIHQQYSIDELDQKSINKTYLIQEAGLTNQDAFTVGIVTRLVYQKGINLILDIIPDLVDHNINLIVLGTGDPAIENQLKQAQQTNPQHVGLFLTYNEQLSHAMIAGLDGFLIPSRYEPCGLTQLYSMQYGTVPIVRNTGGLADTVEDEFSGYLFDDFDEHALLDAVLRAYRDFNENPAKWRKMQINGMNKDLSWTNNAEAWIQLYESIL